MQTNRPLTRAQVRGLFALHHSRNGIAATGREESAFRQEVCVVAVLMPVAFLVPVGAAERVLLAASLLLVLLVEQIVHSKRRAIAPA